ncbi:hypothetical protein [Ichthyobacterium seriolicida]|uniref:Outer membrane protein beta-barrel domain-containing protein n=1 Tax=Ichthyobacterium seriolicida TaxID=242600 RepID=A0A1J1E0M3_9FLAO|nr:hypothetical protein [Ichthyobacterium seriolicida]BAV94477.1 hypothetical protein JBKA6_0464 [Ichthyobacterium seriolicida]
MLPYVYTIAQETNNKTEDNKDDNFSIGFQKTEDNKICNFFIGFQLGKVQDNFHVGANTGVRIIDMFELKATANMSFNYYFYSPKKREILVPYFSSTLGWVYIQPVSKSINVYGESGSVLIIPAYIFSEENFRFGGYGLFGFEFFTDRYSSFFIEMGCMGTGARQNDAYKSVYHNGFLINVGFKHIF